MRLQLAHRGYASEEGGSRPPAQPLLQLLHLRNRFTRCVMLNDLEMVHVLTASILSIDLHWRNAGLTGLRQTARHATCRWGLLTSACFCLAEAEIFWCVPE